MPVLIKGARVIDPASQTDEVLDVLIENGAVARMGVGASAGIQGNRVEVIDGSGKWLVPGFVDLHVHFREPGQEYKEDISSGLRAAVAGGFTTVCAMPNTKPVNDTRAITEMMVARAAESKTARLLPFGAITRGLAGSELTEMADLKEAGALGVSDDGRCVMNAAVMRRAMEYARTFDLLISQHAEDHDLTSGAQMHEGRRSTKLGLRGWPAAAEDVIVARDLVLAELTGARYHVAHISSLGAIRLLREAKSRGLDVSAEVTPHHLLLTDESVIGYDTNCKVNPPLRSEEHIAALQEALADGTIDCIATDHAPHSALEKDCEFDQASPGMTGLETALPALLQLVERGIFSRLRLIEALTIRPARIGRIEAGQVREGLRADLTLIDPALRWKPARETMQSKSLNSPWLGKELVGRVTHTFVAGSLVHAL